MLAQRPGRRRGIWEWNETIRSAQPRSQAINLHRLEIRASTQEPAWERERALRLHPVPRSMEAIKQVDDENWGSIDDEDTDEEESEETGGAEDIKVQNWHVLLTML